MRSHILDVADEVRIKRPAAEVFERISKVDDFFVAAQRKAKIDVAKLSGGETVAVGDRWRVGGRTRLGYRKGVLTVSELAAPHRLTLTAKGRGVIVETLFLVAEETAQTSRLSSKSRVYAASWRIRAMAPLIRLARGRIEKGQRRALKRLRDWIER